MFTLHVRHAPRFTAGLFRIALIITFALSLHGCAKVNGEGGSQTLPPTPLTITVSSLPDGQVGAVYSATLTATGGTLPYSWSVSGGTLPAGLTLNSSTGAITGTPTQAVTSRSVTFKVTDSSSPPLTQTAALPLTITATVTPVSITTTSLPAATVNAPYSQQLTAAGGSGKYVWTLSTPVTGFSLSSSGLLTGTPGSTATLSFSVKAADAADSNNSASSTLTLSVNAPPAISVTVSPTSATVLTDATQQFTATVHNTSNAAVAWQINAITGGNSTTGTVSSSGLYTAPAAVPSPATVTLTAISQADTTKSASAQITITATVTPVSITTTSLPAATVNVPYSQQLTAAGGSGKYVWTLSTPVTGFSLSSSGLLTGTPGSTATLSFSVKAADAANSNNSASSTLTLTVNSPTGTSAYYVSTTGSDSNPGTITSPWRTIQHAANSVQAGATVYVRGGVYTESVNISVSGSAAGGPITFQSYPGETAILDGTGLTPPTSGTQGLISIDGQSYVTIQQFEIRNYQTSSASATPAGIWVSGSGSNIQLLNNVVHNIVTTSEANGNAFGIAVYGTAAPASIDSITISGNQVYNLRTGSSESVNVDGNVTNFVISNNVIHDNDNIGIDVIGFEGVSPNSAYDYARNGEVSGNTVYNISAINNPGESNEYNADGIYVDGGSQITVERNIIHNVDIGIEVASEHKGRTSNYVTVRSNLVYASNSVGISIGGYDNSVGGTDHCTIVNNSLFGNDTKNTGSGELQVQYFATNNLFENNIVYATSQALFINSYTNSEPNPVTADYNLYFSSRSASAAEFVWNGANLTGFSSFQAGTGNDSHSSYADPQFLSLTTPDLHVQLSSPAVSAGNNLGSTVVGTLDIAGNPRVQGSNIDVGAYEQ